MAESINHQQESIKAESTKYSIINLLGKLGASPDKRKLESRRELWNKYKDEIKKENKDLSDKYTGQAEHNLALLNYIKNRIRNGEHFDANSYEFSSVEKSKEAKRDVSKEKRSALRKEIGSKPKLLGGYERVKDDDADSTTATETSEREAPRSERADLVTERAEAKAEAKKEGAPISGPAEKPKEKTLWDLAKESGEERDTKFKNEKAMGKESFLDSRYEDPRNLDADLKIQSTVDEEVYTNWVKFSDNRNWVNINKKGRDTVYEHLTALGMSLDDLKKSMKGHEITMEAICKKAGYKNFKEMEEKYSDYRNHYKEQAGHIESVAYFTKKLEEAKTSGDAEKIKSAESQVAMYAAEVERQAPRVERERPEFIKLLTTISSGRALVKAMGDRETFYYRPQTELAATAEKPLDSETQKTLTVLNDIFPQNKGDVMLDDTKRTLTMYDIGANTTTKDTGYLERHTSYAAAYEEVEEKILDTTSSEKTRENLVKKLNAYIELALIKVGKRGEMASHAVNAEMIKSGKISDNIKALIRVGYVEDLRNTHAVEKAERQESINELSKNPQVVELLKKYKIDHPELTNAQLRGMGRRIDSRLAAGIMIGASQSPSGKMAPAAGVGASFDVGNGCSLYLGLTGIIDPETGAPLTNVASIGVGKKFKITQDTKLTLSLGVSGLPGIGVGASAVVETPIGKSNTDLVLGAGVGFDLLRLQIGAGGVIGVSWNAEREFKNDLEKKYEKAGINDIEKAKNQYEALLKHPVIGKQIMETLETIEASMKTKGQTLSDAYKKTIALEIYESIKQDIENKALNDLDAGVITGGGVMISASILPIMPYITINLGKKTQVLRLVDASTTDVTDEQIREELDQQLSKHSGSSYIDLGKSGRLVMDENGRSEILMDKSVKFDTDEGSSLDSLNKAVGKAKIRFEKTSDGLLKLNIENSRHANINVHLDPEIANTQLIHDARDFYLNTDLQQNLIVTRKEIRYPYRKDGAFREINIYIKKDAVGESTIEKTESAMLTKNIGMAIMESGIKSKIAGNQILNYEEFLEGQKNGTIKRFEIPSRKAYKDAIDKLRGNPLTRKALDGKEEKSRDNLQSLTESFYKNLSAKDRLTLKKITTEYNPALETDYGLLLESFEAELAAKKETKLSALERNFFRNIIIELTFRDVTDRSPKARKELLKHDSAWIKKTFLTYLDSTEFKGSAADKEAIATAVMAHVEKTTFDADQWKTIDPNTTGNQFVSMVGTKKIVGARRSFDYDGARFKMINPKEFSTTSNDASEIKTGAALLEIISPLDTSSPEKLLRSPLALKLSSIIPFAFKPEDVDLYLNILKDGNPDRDEKHAAFYKKFKALVEKVRDYETHAQERWMDLGPEYGNIRIDLDISTSVGLFEKCQNFTIVGKENLKFSIPDNSPIYGGASGEAHVRVANELQVKFRELGLAFGFFPTGIKDRVVEGRRRPTRPDRLETEHAGNVDNGVGKPQQGTTATDTGVAVNQGRENTDGL